MQSVIRECKKESGVLFAVNMRMFAQVQKFQRFLYPAKSNLPIYLKRRAA